MEAVKSLALKEATLKWLAGFVGRLLFVAKVILFVPALIVAAILAPPYWLIFGRTLPCPQWIIDVAEWN